MVHFKRKSFDFVVPPKGLEDGAEVWEIAETGEIFTNYESFLNRRDFYDQRKFTDTISGHTNLTFWEALKRENQGTKDLEDFPEALREPILRKCHMSTFSRLDELVTHLYESFRSDIRPGEAVLVTNADNGSRVEGVVRDKAIFAANQDHPEIARFFVRLEGDQAAYNTEAVVDQQHIQRKRGTFSKDRLTKFLKHTVSRERYEGAPWMVNEESANRYGLDRRVPAHLTQESIAQDKKIKLAIKKGKIDTELPQNFMAYENKIMPRPGPAPSQEEVDEVLRKFRKHLDSGELVYQSKPQTPRQQGGGHSNETHAQKPAQPVVKYPIEDTEVPAKTNGLQRPPLHYLTDQDLFPNREGQKDREQIDMTSTGPLLEVWNTLNVFGDFFCLDSFTFDDFCGAMMVASDQLPCQLFSEIHCAVLEKLINEQGEVLSKLLKDAMDEADEEEEDDEDDEEDDEGASANGEEEEPAEASLDNSTVGSSAKQNGSRSSRARNKASQENGDTVMSNGIDSPTLQHRASEIAEQINWSQRLQQRNFKDGGWEVIMVCILDLLSRKPSYKTACENVLKHLVPIDDYATLQVVRRQYSNMDVNLRIAALQVVTLLPIDTKPFKDFMDKCMQDATETRKEKISYQSKKKPMVRELIELDEQRKLLRPDNLEDDSLVPEEETADGVGAHAGEQEDEDEDYGKNSSDDNASDSEDEKVFKMANRRISDRAQIIKRKREIEEEEQKAMAESKETAEYRKVLRQIEEKREEIRECEDRIEELDAELRENACHRTKMLGRDRFLNRYIWFERNGMSLSGDPESSTAHYGYLNGRLWVQGPDLYDRIGILDRDVVEEKEYRKRFKASIPERMNAELGETQLSDSSQWGYYQTADELDKLLAWLEPKGEREKHLRKELLTWRDDMSTCIKAREEHLTSVWEKYMIIHERVVGIATRKKATAESDRAKWPCLEWEDWAALQKRGRLHLEGPPMGKKTRKPAAEKKQERDVVILPGKRTTRQGKKY